jgi:hypothetical protein
MPGEKNPYVVGNDVVRRYWTVANDAGKLRSQSCPADS